VKYGTILPRLGQLGARYLEQILKDDMNILGALRTQVIDVLCTDDQAVRVILDQHA
jgi:DNA-binding transcriptional regulator LsrR (DeoR family)